MAAAVADPPAGTERSEARPSRSEPNRAFGAGISDVADLSLALGDELLQLLVDPGIDARVGIFR
jgi:hypothetical protein